MIIANQQNGTDSNAILHEDGCRTGAIPCATSPVVPNGPFITGRILLSISHRAVSNAKWFCAVLLTGVYAINRLGFMNLLTSAGDPPPAHRDNPPGLAYR